MDVLDGAAFTKEDISGLRTDIRNKRAPEGISSIRRFENGDVDVYCMPGTKKEVIETWVVKRISEINRKTNKRVRDLIKFVPRVWFKGPAAVRIIEKKK